MHGCPPAFVTSASSQVGRVIRTPVPLATLSLARAPAAAAAAAAEEQEEVKEQEKEIETKARYVRETNAVRRGRPALW